MWERYGYQYMNILSMENISKSYGEGFLFEHTSFYLQEGEKIGIIGINGTGKSTLLRMMAGLEEPDGGKVTMANHVVCSFLPQHPVFDGEDTVIEAVLKKGTEKDLEADGVEDKRTQAKTMLTKLGITDFTALCKNLSGGQRKRLALAAALLAPAGNGMSGKEPTKKNSWKQPDTKLRFSYKEQKDYEVIEEEIACLEGQIEDLEKQILAAATDFVRLNQLTGEKELKEQQLEEKMDRWMYLEELKAKIDAQGKAYI